VYGEGESGQELANPGSPGRMTNILGVCIYLLNGVFGNCSIEITKSFISLKSQNFSRGEISPWLVTTAIKVQVIFSGVFRGPFRLGPPLVSEKYFGRFY